METWQITFSKEAHKSYQRLNPSYRRYVDRLLTKLSRNERLDIKPIKGEKSIFRIRMGKYRILLKAYEAEKTFLIVRLGSRGDVYK